MGRAIRQTDVPWVIGSCGGLGRFGGPVAEAEGGENTLSNQKLAASTPTLKAHGTGYGDGYRPDWIGKGLACATSAPHPLAFYSHVLYSLHFSYPTSCLAHG